MKTPGFFSSVIAVELLQLTYLHRTQPEASCRVGTNPTQKSLKAKSPKLPKVLTVAWALEAVARLGGYLSIATSHWHPGALWVGGNCKLPQKAACSDLTGKSDS